MVLGLNSNANFHRCVILCLYSSEMMAPPKYPLLSILQPAFLRTCILGGDEIHGKVPGTTLNWEVHISISLKSNYPLNQFLLCHFASNLAGAQREAVACFDWFNLFIWYLWVPSMFWAWAEMLRIQWRIRVSGLWLCEVNILTRQNRIKQIKITHLQAVWLGVTDGRAGIQMLVNNLQILYSSPVSFPSFGNVPVL